MALKDWKKENSWYYNKINPDIALVVDYDLMSIYNKTKSAKNFNILGEIMTIAQAAKVTGATSHVYLVKGISSGNRRIVYLKKNFKTKQQALKYAKHYMNTH